ncbi:MAG TPA: hypothetical protein PLM07_13600 [Candidatus Rifleibacterium sp.]|nr:hypothetical protein [Candidatus Rifleibacterium sp.]HPT46920.1 hypothetical protein [Candidatus Rifleibacterium sp.]
MTESSEPTANNSADPENGPVFSQPEQAQLEKILVENTPAPRPISFVRLGFFNFSFILLTLHGPYIFLYMLPNLVMTSQGLDYDMGGIFPHLGAAIAIFGFQGMLAFGLTTLICCIRFFYRRLDAFLISFIAICGLQVRVYYQVYFKTEPAILAAIKPFNISLGFLGLFVIGTLAWLKFRKPALT